MKKICVGFFALVLCLALYVPIVKADNQSFQIITQTLPLVNIGVSYSASINFVYSGVGIPSANLIGLPSGFSINPTITTKNGIDTITITGFLTIGDSREGNQYPLTLILSDQYGGATLSQNYTLTFAGTNPNATVLNPTTFNIVDTTLPGAIVGTPYSATIRFTSSNAYTPTVTFPGLPSGLTVGVPVITSVGNTAAGTPTSYTISLTGTITYPDTFNPVLYLSDQTGVSKLQQYQLVAAEPTNTSIPVATPTPTPLVNPTPPTNSGTDPAGTNISSNGTVYMVTANGQKRPYTSAGAFLSYGFNTWANVVPASSADLALPTGNFIPPRDGKIICSNKGSDTGTCYLITDSQKAAFTSAAVFTGLGFSFSNSLSGDVSFLPSAANISSASQAHPAGVLVNKGGTIYLVGDSGLLGIPDMGTLTSWGYSLTDSVKANAADSAMAQAGVMSTHTAGALSPFGN